MPTSLKISDELKNRVGHLASVRQRTSHWIMLNAIREYVAKEEAKEAFKNEAMDAWVSFKETGLHLTNDDVHDWLDTWGTGRGKTAPQCHN